MMNERARGRKEESLRRRRLRRHSFSFTACFFAALACLIQLPNSIEAGWKGRDGTGCTATYSHKKEGDCAGKDWEERNGWAGIKKDWAWHNDGGCSKDCGGGIQKKRYLYNFKRITSCETKDERMRRCEFTYESTIESDTKEESCNTQACPPPPSPPSAHRCFPAAVATAEATVVATAVTVEEDNCEHYNSLMTHSLWVLNKS